MIILIDNYDSFTYNLYQMIATETQVEVIRNNELSSDEILSMKPKGIIISPGPKTPKEAGVCLELIEKAERSIPILGVCLGHQALAESFGGEVVCAQEIVHGKPQAIFHSRKDLFEKMPLPFEAGRYHSLIVKRESLPNCFIIEAETEEGMIMGMKHVEYPLYGVQFHPESILTPDGAILIEAFLKVCGVTT
ncbi:MAG: aminodeoxychorismate/anthranilate synthase component II [Chlamydiales bacterium]|nr:aminodeoxychorismate/anthranilate synthase component II [Chlamydiales bacterium]